MVDWDDLVGKGARRCKGENCIAWGDPAHGYCYDCMELELAKDEQRAAVYPTGDADG